MQQIADLIFIPQQQVKELSEFEKRRIVQNEVWDLISKEDVRILNRSRFVTWLKAHKWRYNETSLKEWKKDPSKATKPIRSLDKKTYGFMTSHLKTVDDFFFLKSVITDKLNRNDSPTLYILSLNSWNLT